MAILSDRDIEKELGNNICIYPFDVEKIKGASINLSISKLAWSLRTKRSIYNEQGKSIIIPANDTVLVETEEVLYVSNKIAGSFHSKVGIVAKGLGHIGTTLDPGWIGNLLITIHNHSEQDVELKIGDTFISIMFQYLGSKAVFKNTNSHGRPELLKDYDLTEEEDRFFDEDFRKAENLLTKKMTESESYIDFKNELKRGQWLKSNWALSILICLGALVLFFTLKYFFDFSDIIVQGGVAFFVSYITAMFTVFIMQKK